MNNNRPGEFIALVAMLTAMVAMTIDTMLPALGVIANQLGATHENDRHLIILVFFGGLALGTLIFGPISDSVGRKRAIYVGLVFYLIGCFICYFATSFPMLIFGRLVQGFGAASPRVVSLAMVRDGAKGADMARIMSYVMSVFMLVPVIAPSIGQLVLLFAEWHDIFLGFAVFAVIAGLWLAFRQPETLPPQERRPFSATALWGSAKEVVSHPIALGYTLAAGFLFASFNVYLSTSQQVFMEQYKQGERFALWFGGLAIGIALSMILNGRYVKKVGMRRMAQRAMFAFVTVWTIMLVACLLTNGQPPLWLVGVLMFLSFFSSGMTFGNFNAIAMEPMGHIAGMAASVSGTAASLMAIGLGGAAARQYDGSLLPVALSFVVFGLCSLLSAEWAERRRPTKP